MTRIGIITFHFQNNYGALLQTYATFRYLKKFGEPELIDFRCPSIPLPDAPMPTGHKWWDRFFLGRIRPFLQAKLRTKRFVQFRKQYLKLSPETYYGDQAITKRPPQYDVYVTGSDQIWNVSLSGSSAAYFLNFTSSPRKYAFASSVGHGRMSDEEKSLAKTYLPAFAQLAVREKETAGELETLLGRPVQTVLDPVFLLSKTAWEEVARPVRLPQKPYVAVYALQDSPAIRRALQYVNTLGLPIVFIGKKLGKCALNIKTAGPQEFLHILAHARYIVTNSFHGFAFGLIFQKQLFVCEHTTRNLRLMNLLNQIGADGKQVLADTPDVSSCQVDGQAGYSKLDIEHGRDYLAQIFNPEKKI